MRRVMLYDLFSNFHQIAQCVQAITTEKNEPASSVEPTTTTTTTTEADQSTQPIPTPEHTDSFTLKGKLQIHYNQ